MNLQQLIDNQKFDYVNSDITEEKFPVVDRKIQGYKLFHFDRYISSEDAILEMKKEGYVPANINELLIWKEWNNKDTVIALGSVAKVSGRRHVPCLDKDGSGRGLFLYWFDNDWDANYRFLAVRTSSLESSETSHLNALTLEQRVTNIEDWICKEAHFINPFE